MLACKGCLQEVQNRQPSQHPGAEELHEQEDAGAPDWQQQKIQQQELSGCVEDEITM